MTLRLWELVGKRGKTLRTGREMWWGDGCCHLVLSSVTKYSSRFSETLNHHLEIVLAVRGRLSIVLYSSVGGRSRRERFSEVAFKETGNRWRVEKVPLFPMCLSWGQNGWWCGAGGLLRIFSLSPTVLFHPFHTGRMCDKMNKNPPSVSKRVYIYIYIDVFIIFITRSAEDLQTKRRWLRCGDVELPRRSLDGVGGGGRGNIPPRGGKKNGNLRVVSSENKKKQNKQTKNKQTRKYKK